METITHISTIAIPSLKKPHAKPHHKQCSLYIINNVIIAFLNMSNLKVNIVCMVITKVQLYIMPVYGAQTQLLLISSLKQPRMQTPIFKILSYACESTISINPIYCIINYT